MAPSLLVLIASSAIGYIAYKAITFLGNYANARRSNFPIYISPVPSRSIAWMILGPALRSQYKKYLPAWLFDRLDIISHGWELHRKTDYHDKLGKTFVLVTPDECSIW